jgi:hypothetical protein
VSAWAGSSRPLIDLEHDVAVRVFRVRRGIFDPDGTDAVPGDPLVHSAAVGPDRQLSRANRHCAERHVSTGSNVGFGRRDDVCSPGEHRLSKLVVFEKTGTRG